MVRGGALLDCSVAAYRRAGERAGEEAREKRGRIETRNDDDEPREPQTPSDSNRQLTTTGRPCPMHCSVSLPSSKEQCTKVVDFFFPRHALFLLPPARPLSLCSSHRRNRVLERKRRIFWIREPPLPLLLLALQNKPLLLLPSSFMHRTPRLVWLRDKRLGRNVARDVAAEWVSSQ